MIRSDSSITCKNVQDIELRNYIKVFILLEWFFLTPSTQTCCLANFFLSNTWCFTIALKIICWKDKNTDKKKALAWNRRRKGTMENFANRLELIWINSRLDQKSSFDPIVCIVQYIGWVILRKSLAGLIHIWLKFSNKWCKTWMWANQGIFHSPWLHYGITASNSMHKFTVKSRLYGLVQRNKLKTMIESIELGSALATVNDSWSFILFSPTVLIYA